MRRQTRSILITITVLLAVAAAFWFSGPYRTMAGIRGALARGDIPKLKRLVNFPVLQRNVGAQVGERIRAGMSGRLNQLVGTNNTQAMVDKAVQAMVSPAGLGVLLQGDALLKRIKGDTQEDGKLVPSVKPMDPLSNSRNHFTSPTRFEAAVDVESGPVVFVFEPDGLQWQLTDIRLPPRKP